MRILHLQEKIIVPLSSFLGLFSLSCLRMCPCLSSIPVQTDQRFPPACWPHADICKYAVAFDASSIKAAISLDAKIASKGRLLRGAQKIG
ncbi:hypothetical protein DL95DRAFT_380532, partial [Leptodontidium sp. 2 PMI_412]